jgi:hypothetical protein
MDQANANAPYAWPVPREALPCAVSRQRQSLREGSRAWLPSLVPAPVSHWTESAAFRTAQHRVRVPAGASRRALPVWCTGLASKAMETVAPVLGSIPRLSARDPIWVSYDEG